AIEIDAFIRLKVEIEFRLGHKLYHPNIVKVLKASHVTSPPFAVYKDAANRNLRLYLNLHGYIKAIYIHISTDGPAKVCYFSLSVLRSCSLISPNKLTLGGVRWSAPEWLTSRPTFASDICFFLAMCMIEAATEEIPFLFLSSVHSNKVTVILEAFAAAEEVAEENSCTKCPYVLAAGSRFCSQYDTQLYIVSTRSTGNLDNNDEDAQSDDIPIPVLLDALQSGNNGSWGRALSRHLQLCIDEAPRKNLCDID
ncbi:hypothetical protein GN958_ATG15343, partial [Phytophthora infestans]